MNRKFKLTFDGAVQAYVENRLNGIIVLEMKEAVNGKLLEEAVNMALPYHPLLRTRLCHGLMGYYLEENLRPAIVRESDWSGEIQYGTEEYNELPFVVTYQDQRIAVSEAHLLGDGMGELQFIKTFMHFYLEGMGVILKEDDGIPTPEQIAASTQDAFKALGIRGIKKPENYPEASKPAEIRNFWYETEPRDNYVYQLEFSSPVMHKINQTLKVGTASVFAAIANKALVRAVGLRKGCINTYMTLNLRPYFDCYTEAGFTTNAILNYDASKEEQYFAYDAVDFKKQLDEFRTPEILDYEISKINKLNGVLEPAIMPLAARGFNRMLYSNDAVIILSHMNHLNFSDEMSEHIERIYLTGTESDDRLMLLHGTEFGDRVYLRVVDNIRDNRFIEAFEEVLRENKIPYKLNIMPGHGLISFCPKCWEE